MAGTPATPKDPSDPPDVHLESIAGHGESWSGHVRRLHMQVTPPPPDDPLAGITPTT
jgi:hypothetical protein